MEAKKSSWWQKNKRPLSVIGIIAVLVVAIALIILEVRTYGTGFTGKTLWDWLQLLASLAIPVVVGFGAVWFTTRQGKVAEAENNDNQREAALQSYIDKMSELLLEKNLRESGPEKEVRNIARVRTLTVLPRLDAIRKASLLQFLHESGLIAMEDKNIIDLEGADLSFADLSGVSVSMGQMLVDSFSGANLSFANLRGAGLNNAILMRAKLRGADLNGARLEGAHLMGADLYGARLNNADLSVTVLFRANLSTANLSGADLGGASLSEANLSGAQVDTEQLYKASSLRGATMPDGSKHP